MDRTLYLMDTLIALGDGLLLDHPIAPYGNDYSSIEDMIRHLFSAEGEYHQSTVDAVNFLIKNGTASDEWDAWTRYFVFLRLQSAVDYLQQQTCLHPNGTHIAYLNDDLSDKEAMELLLGAMWDEYKKEHWLKAVAVAYYTGLPLYGVEPAQD